MQLHRVEVPGPVKLIYSTDWHLSATPLGRRSSTYTDEILGKIEFKREQCQKYDAIGICGGDVFHHKNPKSPGNSYSLTNRLIEILKDYPQGKMFGTHGNHDIIEDRTDSIPGQPFGTLLQAEAYQDLSQGSVIFTDGEVNIQVDSYPYADDMVTLERVLNAPPRDPDAHYRIVLMHQYGNPGGQGSLFGHPTIGYDQMADCDYDMALWGHDHSRASTVTVGNCTHIRMGSLSRASMASDEVDRSVSLVMLSFSLNGVNLKEIQVPTKPLEIAFRTADVEIQKSHKAEEVVNFFKDMDTAVASINSSDPREVLQQLARDRQDIYSLAVDLCGL